MIVVLINYQEKYNKNGRKYGKYVSYRKMEEKYVKNVYNQKMY